MNFKDFKKVDVTSTHTVFKHPSGHTIQIAHDSLTPEQKKQMREIPIQSAMEKLREQREAVKMAKGGGLYENIHAKRERIEQGSGERMRKPGSKGAPTEEAFKQSAKTAKKMAEGGEVEGDEDAFEKLQSEMQQAKEMPMPGEAPYSVPVQGSPVAGYAQDLLQQRPDLNPQELQQIMQKAPEGLQGRTPNQILGVGSVEQAAKPEEKLENVQLEQPSPEQPQVAGSPSIGAAIGVEGALQQIEGARELAEAQKVKSIAETEAIGKSLQQMQESLTAAQKQRQLIQSNIDRLTKSVEEGTLKPDRVLGTGTNKIMNVIGLVLGGAMQFATLGIVPNLIKKAIDDDIEQQKSELEQKNNLLSYNLKLLGNINDAENVTRMQMATIADLQARKAALKSSDKEAMGRYMVASGEIQSKLFAPYMQQIEQQAAIRQAASQPITSPGQVLNMIQSRIVDKNSQRQAIKEYGEYKNLMSGVDRVKQVMQEQADLNTLANRIKAPIQTSQRLKTMQAQLFPIIKNMTGEGRLTDTELETLIKPFMVKLTTSPETVNQMTTDLINSIMSKMGSVTPTLELYQINLPKPIQAKQLPTMKRK